MNAAPQEKPARARKRRSYGNEDIIGIEMVQKFFGFHDGGKILAHIFDHYKAAYAQSCLPCHRVGVFHLFQVYSLFHIGNYHNLHDGKFSYRNI